MTQLADTLQVETTRGPMRVRREGQTWKVAVYRDSTGGFPSWHQASSTDIRHATALAMERPWASPEVYTAAYYAEARWGERIEGHG